MAVTDVKTPARPRLAKLDDLSESQIRAIRSIPHHDQAIPDAIEASRPASIFTDPRRYELEQAQVFRRLPVPVSLSARLPEPGSVLAHDGYGVPLVLTRDKDGVVRAFLNACQHKGSKVVETCEPHKAGRLVCPYHAWTYKLDGQLMGVPRQETFAGLDKSARPLAQLPCQESGGLIWVILDRHAPADFSSLSDQLAIDFTAMGIPEAHVYGHRRFDLKANWKLVLEPFLEGYHVQRLHAQSIGDMFADVPNVYDRFGRHTRQISGKMNFTPDLLAGEVKNIHDLVTHAYLAFPSTVVVTSPYYISVMIIMPRATGRSVVDYYMLTRGPPDNPKAENLYARSYELILKVFGTEDFRAAEISQDGLESGALDTVVYGGLEHAIPEFYETLEAAFV
ncbi:MULTISPECIES: SRPBCC family protein [unclassified Phenylobacterium]|uniref:aromatic ring-hydroxylating oxygenase subunit alpha n=1 Tax=unclassified Phenylobacterium TaxID=2640670 RepID=UPI00083A5DB7|nr:MULTISPECIES: aromatic ring-hydroxylating dioxygenase subunit alpha [unclassified Phenylobacterium]